MSRDVKRGQLWKHYKGTVYRIVDVVFREDDRALLVIYARASGDGATWARPLSEWHDRVPGGVARYELLGEGKE